MKTRVAIAVLTAVLAAEAAAAAGAGGFALGSSAFRAGARIPRVYTCDGRNVSPPLKWTAPPRGTKSLAILVDDPDAPGGTFTHWIAWNIPAKARSLPTGARMRFEGLNDAGRIGYTGPCPPSGVHRYVFRLYALRSRIAQGGGASRAAFERALSGRVLAVARLVGRYGR